MDAVKGMLVTAENQHRETCGYKDSVTTKLAAFTLGTTFEDIPANVVEALHMLAIDAVGATLRGAALFGNELHGYAKDIAGARDASLIGGAGVMAPAELAAAVNAQLCQLSGFESTGPGLHPGPLVAMTALAVGQKTGASGRDILSAMAVGYEAMCRFHFSYLREANVTQNNAVAAIISARLLKLDAAQTANAISLAFEFPTREITYLRPKFPKRVSAIPMGFLFSARAGVQAAMLAARGFASLHDELDARGDTYDLVALAEWPKTFAMTAKGIALKPYPAGHASHMVLQLAGELRDAHQIDPAAISRIRVGVADLYTVPHQSDPAPDTHLQAVVSVPWTIAMQMYGVVPGPLWSDSETLEVPAYRQLAARVELVEHAPASIALKEMRLDDVEGWVEITTPAGVVAGQKRMAETSGSSARPLSRAMLFDKFRTLASPQLGPDGAERLFNALQSLPGMPDVRALAPLL
ncbi:MmgE/PrpD family protein [Polymorphobacter sp.]|uniref:MmgE/PrpD family protein n=1 Tax=Polymorphobacter sp. TaxID=1909290 RepID=UPI003F6F881F